MMRRRLLRGLEEWKGNKKMRKSNLISDSNGRNDFDELDRILKI
jgi:hypothetical protein